MIVRLMVIKTWLVADMLLLLTQEVLVARVLKTVWKLHLCLDWVSIIIMCKLVFQVSDLSQIISNTATINFTVDNNSSREDLGLYANSTNTSKKLEAIEINAGTYCSKFQLNHTYFHDKVTTFETYPFAKRLKLLSVQQTDCTNTSLK